MAVDWLTTMVLPAVAAGAVTLLALGATGVARTWLSGILSNRVDDASGRALRLAGSLGFEALEVRDADLWEVEIAGVLEGCSVQIRWGRAMMLPVIEVVVGGAPAGLWLRSSGQVPGIGPVHAEPPREVGDPHVDRMDIRGPEMEVLSLLGGDEAREVLLGVAEGGLSGVDLPCVEIADGQVLVRGVGEMRDAFKVEQLLEQARALTNVLEGGAGDPMSRVARHVREASVPGVRRRCLDVLIERRAEHAKDAARAALGDPAPSVRLRAARWLGDSDTLIALATDPTSPADVVRVALQYVDLRTDRGKHMIRYLLGHADPDVLAAALHRAGRALGAEAVPALEELLEGPPLEQRFGDEAGRIALGIAHALGEADAPEAEPLLLHLLEVSEDDVRLESIRSLGRVGTPAAVQTLQELAGPPLSHSRRVVDEAVARIQSRVEHPDAGALSMTGVADEPGALSLAEEGGGLSLPTESPEESEETQRRPPPDRERS